MVSAARSRAKSVADTELADPPDVKKKRTAVLVVHGMGSQRALDTVRGVVNAVWMDDEPSSKRYWLHPEKRNNDVDLSVITTNEIPGTIDKRSADFHELYWAHLMSETRAVAVLLWLFELVRKGPRLKAGMRALWWGATIYLCLLVQSVVLLVLHGILLLLSNPPLIDEKVQFGVIKEAGSIFLSNHPYHEPEALLLAPFFVLFMAATFAAIFATWRGAWKILVGAVALAAISGAFFYYGIAHETLTWLTSLFLPILISLCVAAIAMGRWGAIAMIAAYLLSSCFFVLYLNARYLVDLSRLESPGSIFALDGGPFSDILQHGWIFWSLNERYSAVIAVAIILLYIALYALFLQPFLGDAARYFRASPGNVLVRREIRKQAVDTLDALHNWGSYDRIIVVAHSLGTVVAYDMLRAYFSRVNNGLPQPAKLEPEFSQIDNWDESDAANEDAYRKAGRALIAKIASKTVNGSDASTRKLPAWLVTDFVTLGSPLTHAHYLMCDGRTEGELVADFKRRVAQREFPTCPPKKQDYDGRLSFANPNTGKKEFHHAALFGMTRWTNLYFPLRQLFWGDAVGGPLTKVWGRCVKDVEVSTCDPPKPAFFTHTAYWSLGSVGGREAPQIVELVEAINLEDK
jgi:hypothetical protein